MNKQEALEKKERLITASREMQTLSQDLKFINLLERLDKKTLEAKDSILSSSSWEEFLERRGFYQGIRSLRVEVDSIISKGISAQRSLKNT